MDIKGIENIREHKIVRKWDAVVLLVFLALIIALICVSLMPKGDYVEVYESGKLIYRYSMNSYGEYDIEGLLTLVIDKEGVMVKNATCPDKLCEMQGHIHTNGASIVCLPNKISIVIKGDTNGVDAVS